MANCPTTATWAASRHTGIGALDSPLFTDYLVSGLSLRTGVGGSAPTLTQFRGGIYAYAFAASGPAEEAHFAVHILHDLRVGTTPTFHVHWSHDVLAPAGDVKWQIEYTLARGYGAGAFPDTYFASSVQTAGAQYTHHTTDDDDMPIAPALAALLEPDAVLLGRVYRDSGDAQDTFASSAFLLHLDLHYEKGQIGTQERNRPFTSAGFGA